VARAFSRCRFGPYNDTRRFFPFFMVVQSALGRVLPEDFFLFFRFPLDERGGDPVFFFWQDSAGCRGPLLTNRLRKGPRPLTALRSESFFSLPPPCGWRLWTILIFDNRDVCSSLFSFCFSIFAIGIVFNWASSRPFSPSQPHPFPWRHGISRETEQLTPLLAVLNLRCFHPVSSLPPLSTSRGFIVLSSSVPIMAMILPSSSYMGQVSIRAIAPCCFFAGGSGSFSRCCSPFSFSNRSRRGPIVRFSRENSGPPSSSTWRDFFPKSPRMESASPIFFSPP